MIIFGLNQKKRNFKIVLKIWFPKLKRFFFPFNHRRYIFTQVNIELFVFSFGCTKQHLLVFTLFNALALRRLSLQFRYSKSLTCEFTARYFNEKVHVLSRTKFHFLLSRIVYARNICIAIMTVKKKKKCEGSRSNKTCDHTSRLCEVIIQSKPIHASASTAAESMA